MSSETSKTGMSVIVKTVARWLKAFILLYGIYIVLYGHLTPGGGFAGGVIIACAFIMLTLSDGQKHAMSVLPKHVASELDSIGALIFLIVAVIGMLFAGAFFKNFVSTSEGSQYHLFSAGVIPICNIGIGLKVGASLFMVFAMLAALHVALRDDGKREIRRRGGEE